jgi:hypothetical protein
MPSPYSGEEVAAAILAAARKRAIPLADVRVRADDTARVWAVEAKLAGETSRAVFPFASPAGIYTPAELADRFLGEAWPFG